MPSSATHRRPSRLAQARSRRLLAGVWHVREAEIGRVDQVEVDEQRCVIRGVKVLGIAGKNKHRTYPLRIIESAASLYDGRPVNINHPRPGDDTRDFHDRFGWLENVRLGDGGLFADLRYNPEHQDASKVLWFARHNPKMLGLSPDHYIREADEHGNALMPGSRYAGPRTVTEIVHVHAVDLVADPSTTNGLKEAMTMDPLNPTPETPTAPEGDSVQSLRDHICKMVEESIGSIEDTEKLRKLSAKFEDFLAKVSADDTSEGTGESAAPTETEEMEALRRSSDPKDRAIVRLLDAQQVREAALKAEIDAIRTREAAAQGRTTARARAKAAGLPDLAITDVWLDDLAAKDVSGQDKLIADRKALLGQSKGAISQARESVEKLRPGETPPEAPKVDDLVAAVRNQRY